MSKMSNGETTPQSPVIRRRATPFDRSPTTPTGFQSSPSPLSELERSTFFTPPSTPPFSPAREASGNQGAAMDVAGGNPAPAGNANPAAAGEARANANPGAAGEAAGCGVNWEVRQEQKVFAIVLLVLETVSALFEFLRRDNFIIVCGFFILSTLSLLLTVYHNRHVILLFLARLCVDPAEPDTAIDPSAANIEPNMPEAEPDIANREAICKLIWIDIVITSFQFLIASLSLFSLLRSAFTAIPLVYAACNFVYVFFGHRLIV